MTHSRLPNFSRLVSGGVKEEGMKGWRERAAEMEFLGATLPKHH